MMRGDVVMTWRTRCTSLVRNLLLSIFALALCSAPLYAQDQEDPSEETEVVEEEGAEEKEWAQTDAAIDARLGAIYAQISTMSDVTHRVEAGLVTLGGKTTKIEARERAEAIARRIETVLAVQNLIEVPEAPVDVSEDNRALKDLQDEALQEQLATIYGSVEELAQVDIMVRAGVAKLSGRVQEEDDSDKAAELAKSLDGILYVDNDIIIPTEVSERVKPAWTRAKDLLSGAIAFAPLLLLGVVLLALAWFAARAVRRWDWLYSHVSDRPLVQELARQLTGGAVFLVGVLLVLELFDITTLVGAVLGTAGVAGLALGFAFQDIVENYLASLMLSARQPFRKGDTIKLNDHIGKVARMTMRDTVLITFDGNHVRIPNAQIFKGILTNFTLNPRRRIGFSVGLGVEESLLEARSLGIEALRSIDGVFSDPAPFMIVDELADSSVVVIFHAWFDQTTHDHLAIRSEAIRRVKVRFDQEGIEMPEPTQRINFVDASQTFQDIDFDSSSSASSISSSSEEDESDRPKSADEPLVDDTLQRTIKSEDEIVDAQIKREEGDEGDLL